MTGAHADGSARLTQAAYWQVMQSYLRAGDVLFVDHGTSYAIFCLKLPPGCTFLGSVNWGSIGCSVGALLGALTAAPDRRQLLFVGDGSFQVGAGPVDHSPTRPQAVRRQDQRGPAERPQRADTMIFVESSLRGTPRSEQETTADVHRRHNRQCPVYVRHETSPPRRYR